MIMKSFKYILIAFLPAFLSVPASGGRSSETFVTGNENQISGKMAACLYHDDKENGKKDKKTEFVATENVNDDSQQRYNNFYLEAIRQQEKGNYTAAFDLLRHCVEINPNAPEAYFSLSSYYAEMKNDSAVVSNLQKAASLNPSNETYLERLGQAYINDNQYDEAIKVYEKLADNQKDRTDVLNILIQLYQQNHDYANMIKALNRVETIDGATEETALAKMRVYSLQGKKKEEYKELENLVKKHPYDSNYVVMVGNWLLQNNKPKDALERYSSVLKDEPDNAYAKMSMIDYYKSQKQTAKANEMIEEMLISDKTPSENKYQLMRQVVEQNEQKGGDSTEVLNLFHRVLAKPQTKADMAELYAAYVSLKNMPKDTVNAALQQVLNIAPDNSSARLQLIQSVWSDKKYDKVIELSKPAIEYNPDEMAFYYFLGLAYFQKDERDKALDAFRRGVSQINAESNRDIVSDFYAIMGDILQDKGMSDKAFAAYDSCLQWKADNISCLNNYAYYLSINGKDISKAEQMSYKTIKAEPKNATYLDTYAWILFIQKRYEEAKIYIDQAVQNDSDASKIIIEHAGDIYAMNKDIPKALVYWQKAVKAGADDPLLFRKIKLKKYLKQ